MMTYALGRGLERFDKCTVDAIVADLPKHEKPLFRPGDRHRDQRSFPEAQA